MYFCKHTHYLLTLILSFKISPTLRPSTQVIQLSQPLFCKFFILGAILLSLSNLFWIGPNTESSCNLRTWTFHLAFTFTFSALNVKMYRVWKLFTSNGISEGSTRSSKGGGGLKKIKVTKSTMIKLMSVFFAIDVILLLLNVWHNSTSSVVKYDNFSNLLSIPSQSCREGGEDYTPFLIVLIIFKVIIIAGGGILSYLNRRVEATVNESHHLYHAMLNFFLAFLFYIIISSAIEAPAVLIAMRTSTVTWSSLGGVLLIFRPKIIAVVKARKTKADLEALAPLEKAQENGNIMRRSFRRLSRRNSRSELSETVLLDGDFRQLARMPSDLMENVIDNITELNLFTRPGLRRSGSSKVSDVGVATAAAEAERDAATTSAAAAAAASTSNVALVGPNDGVGLFRFGYIDMQLHEDVEADDLGMIDI